MLTTKEIRNIADRLDDVDNCDVLDDVANAVDAIRQLIKERDEAVQYIKELARDTGECSGCRYYKYAGGEELCKRNGIDSADGYCKYWVWRGCKL